MSAAQGEAYKPGSEESTETNVGFLGLRRWTQGDRKIGLAGRHLSILGLLVLLALVGTIWSAYEAIGTTSTSGQLVLEATSPWTWSAIFSATVLGAALNRMVAVSFTGFKFKRYDPLTFPHRLTQAFRAPFIATSLIALGAVSLENGQTFDAANIAAISFGLGYFSDLAFERFRDLVRTVLGLGVDSDTPETGRVYGIDVPLEALKLDQDRLPTDLAHLGDHVEQLRAAGFEYGHDLIEHWRTAEGRAAIKDRTDLSQSQIETLVQVLDVARTGATVPLAARLVKRGIRSGEAVATCDDQLVSDAFRDLEEGATIPARELRRNAEHLLGPVG